MTDVNLLKHQLEFCLDNSTRYLGLVGGYGAGKTFSFCVKTCIIASKNIGHKGVIMEPTFSMVKRTLIPEMLLVLDMLNIPYDYLKSDSIFTLHFEEGDCEIYCLSGENYRRMAGLNLAFFGVDEADTMNTDTAQDMWRMGMSRLRKGSAYQGYTTSTPEGFKFLYKFFDEEVKDAELKGKILTDRRLIKGKTRDNPFLPPEYIEDLLNKYPPALIKSYLEGEFTNLTSGQIYYTYDRFLNNTDYTIKDCLPHDPLFIGQDFNIGKCSSVVHIIVKGIAYAVDEIQGARDTEEVIRIIKQRYPGKSIVMCPDAAGGQEKTSASRSDIALLKQAGFEVKAPNKNPFVKDRINAMNAMLCNAKGVRRYFINNKYCPVYAKALEQQVYNKAGEPDKKHDQDHPNDAAGYFINMMFPITAKAKLTSY